MESDLDCHGNNDEGVTEVPDCQGEKDADKEEEYVRLLKVIQVDVKRSVVLYCK